MLDIHLTEIKNGHEIYIRRVPEAGDSARTKHLPMARRL